MSDKKKLVIENLHARVEETPILQGVNLTIETGQLHAIMGPNGSGKSTLANVIMGHPGYEVTEGKIFIDGEDVLEMEPNERAAQGLFLAFQYPVEIPGIKVAQFLKRAMEAQLQTRGSEEKFKVSEFIKNLRANVKFLDMDPGFINRYLNTGFSGGEKKRMEILQMLTLEPRFALLDETDSGLDIDALKVVSKGVNKLRSDRFGGLVITHYDRILQLINPDFVHIFFQGRIVESGGSELAQQLEENGYDWVKEKYGSTVVAS